jgi:predicted transcriptional regulator
MDKTTLYLDPGDYRRLKRIAATRKQAPAALVREAVAEYVARHAPAGMPKSLVGAFRSGMRDFAERSEEFLDGFGDDSSSRARRGRRRR